MFEVKIEKELFDKLFKHAMFKNDKIKYFNGYVQIFPKDETLFQYSKNFKRLGTLDGTDPIGKSDSYFWKYCQYFKNYEKYKNMIIPYNFTTVFYQDCYIIFEFETEEEAFYFKLKYC